MAGFITGRTDEFERPTDGAADLRRGIRAFEQRDVETAPDPEGAPAETARVIELLDCVDAGHRDRPQALIADAPLVAIGDPAGSRRQERAPDFEGNRRGIAVGAEAHGPRLEERMQVGPG